MQEEVVTSVGDSEPPAPASVETIGKVEDVAAAAPIPAVNDDDDDPPIEIMREPPAPAPASIEPELGMFDLTASKHLICSHKSVTIEGSIKHRGELREILWLLSL